VVIAQAVHESDYGLEAKWRDVYDSVATDFDFMTGIMVGDRHRGEGSDPTSVDTGIRSADQIQRHGAGVVHNQGRIAAATGLVGMRL
jgi:hypothetical protein